MSAMMSSRGRKAIGSSGLWSCPLNAVASSSRAGPSRIHKRQQSTASTTQSKPSTSQTSPGSTAESSTASSSSSSKPTRGPASLLKPRAGVPVAVTPPPLPPGQGSSGSRNDKEKQPVREDYNTSLMWMEEPLVDHQKYRRVTAADIHNRREPPTQVKMLVREFIHDSLYNRHYGYFSKKATIFKPPPGGYDFPTFRDQTEFQEVVAKRYADEYGDMIEGSLGRQVWHTPTELFSPHYAQALVSAIVQRHLSTDPSSDLIIYELGAGNGSFMFDSLRFLRETHPDLYARTKYHIIEISPELARLQKERAAEGGVRDKVEIIQSDFFEWKGMSDEPCYVVALEVLDNFSHDMVRWDINTLEPYQSLVTIDSTGDFGIIYETITDPALSSALSYYRRLSSSHTTANLPPLIGSSSLLRRIYTELPFAPNLSRPDFIPTKAIAFLERLRKQLPKHKLLIADFASLPDTIPGRNAPVVQTRLGTKMVDVQTFLVKQGYFDIFFPTNFELLRDISALIDSDANSQDAASEERTQSVSSAKTNIGISSQSAFVAKHGGKELAKKLTTKNGVNIMDAMYGNAKVMF